LSQVVTNKIEAQQLKKIKQNETKDGEE